MRKQRNNAEWFRIITECRQSGLSDFEWCKQNGISSSTFYKAVTRVRRSSVDLPKSRFNSETVYDITSVPKQDVVPIQIIPEPDSIDSLEMTFDPNPKYQMMISCGKLSVQFSNDVNPDLLEHTLRILGGMS